MWESNPKLSAQYIFIYLFVYLFIQQKKLKINHHQLIRYNFNVWCPTFINPRVATTIQTFLSLLPSSCPLLLSYILLTAGPLRGPPVKNIQISRGPRPPGQGSRGPRRTPLARTLIFQGIMDVGLVCRTSKLKGEVTCSNLALVNIFTPLHWVQPWNKQKQLY